MPFIGIALLLAAVIGGGTSFAAQSALPGDALWKFKTEVFGRLRQSDTVVAIQPRLQEAQELAAQGKLTTKMQAELVSNITAHAAAAEKQIIESESRGDYAAASAIATNLQAALAKGTPGALDLRALLDPASRLSAEASAKAKQ